MTTSPPPWGKASNGTTGPLRGGMADTTAAASWPRHQLAGAPGGAGDWPAELVQLAADDPWFAELLAILGHG